EWLATRNDILFKRLHHTGNGVEPAPAVSKGADAGQHDAVDPRQHLGIVGDNDVLTQTGIQCRALKGLRGRMQISGAVIDNRRRHRGVSASGKRPITSELLSRDRRSPPACGFFTSARMICPSLSYHCEKKRRSAVSILSPMT